MHRQNLTERDIEPYLSEYLVRGYQSDSFLIDSIAVDANTASCVFSVVEHFVPSDGEYHLTLPTAFLVIAQAAIIWGHVKVGLAKKESEVWVTSLNLRCPKPVLHDSRLSLDLKLERSRRLQDGMLFSGSVDVEEGSFVGKASFYLPLPKSCV